MLSGPAACRAAVQRRIRAKSDTVWITDDVLARALQRFCLVTRSSQRDASSVPGPMESRRRMGKRRIAHLSEAVYTPGQDSGLLWGLAGASDRQQWRWEAPSRRQLSPVTEGIPPLPVWLSKYQPVLVEGLPEVSKPEEYMLGNREELRTNIEDDMRTFKESLKAESTNRIQALCESFNQSFKQNLVLGLVVEETLSESLQYITEAIREATTDKSLAASRCLSFYNATWDGIMGCKVLRPVDLRSDPLEKLLALLGELHCTLAVQTLAVNVIRAASRGQVARMERSILTVAKAWLSSWTSLGIDYGRSSVEATTSSHFHQAVPNTLPLTESVAIFAEFLGQLRSTMARKILHASTDHLITTLFADFKGPTRALKTVRYSWVSVVANMRCVDDTLLREIWSRMNVTGVLTENSGQYVFISPHLTLHESCNLLLDHWVSHGQIRTAERVRALYMASVQKYGKSDSVGHLIQALNQCNERYWKKVECLFQLLRGLRKSQALYHVFQNLVAQDLITASAAGREIYEMSRIDPRRALNMYKLYREARHIKTRFHLDWCPNLIIAMIRSPDFAPAEIWGLLEPSRANIPGKPLHPARIRLVHRMALEFAAVEFRTPRVALRNVMQCMLYLRRHGVPLSVDMSRALTEAGITRNLLDERWVGRSKAKWILDIVEKVEGYEVSTQMDQMLQIWLVERIAGRQQLEREGNPLRVGAID